MKSSIFSELRCFSSFLRIQEYFRKKLKLSLFLSLLTKDQIIFKKTIVYGCLLYGINQNSFTLLAHDFGI